MAETEAQLLAPVALRKLRAAGSKGMEVKDFSEICRVVDAYDHPLVVLQKLCELSEVVYIKGSKPVRVRAL